MIYLDIDGDVPRSEGRTKPDLVFDSKQLAGHLRRSKTLRQAVIGAVVWATLLDRDEVNGNEERANDILSVAHEEFMQLGDMLTDGVS